MKHLDFRYRRKREKLVERTAVSRLPTKWGSFEVHCYRSKLDGMEHIALVKVRKEFTLKIKKEEFFYDKRFEVLLWLCLI